MSSATKLKKSESVTGFVFQEVPLDEAINAVIAGDGNYAEVKAKLLEALPQLPEGKAFAFGLLDGDEVEEDQRRGICMALNSTLKKAKLPWRVTYSGIKKLFVCVPPATPKNYKPKESNGYVPKSGTVEPDIEKAILQLRDSGLSVQKIVEKGFPIHRVRYICYQKFPLKKKKIEAPTNGKSHMGGAPSIDAIETTACKLFGVPSVQLRGKLIPRDLNKVRKAICYVAIRKYHHHFDPVAKQYGLAPQSLWGINSDAVKIPDYIKRLSAAI